MFPAPDNTLEDRTAMEAILLGMSLRDLIYNKAFSGQPEELVKVFRFVYGGKDGLTGIRHPNTPWREHSVQHVLAKAAEYYSELGSRKTQSLHTEAMQCIRLQLIRQLETAWVADECGIPPLQAAVLLDEARDGDTQQSSHELLEQVKHCAQQLSSSPLISFKLSDEELLDAIQEFLSSRGLCLTTEIRKKL